MSVCILYYDGFCEFEVVLCAMQFRGRCVTAALENRVYISEEKQKFLPDKTIDELEPGEIELLIIPGGNPEHLYQDFKLRNFITELSKKNKFIAGICGGTFLMAAYGLLEGRKCTGDSSGLIDTEEYISLFKDAFITNEDVVVDCNTITSKGQAFVELSVELGRLMGVYENEEEALSNYRWIKNIK